MPLIVLANREPIQHDRAPDGRIVERTSASGLVTALQPLIESCGGVWVAHGSGSADQVMVDRRDGLDVPPANPRYRLRRVWLSEKELQGFYYGFSNEGLWPLCHQVHVQPLFRTADFDFYRAVNRRFAEAVCEEARDDVQMNDEPPLILVQDYHFALAPWWIRKNLPRGTIVTFWHIPWPNSRQFEICPWGRQLLSGLLASSLVGFQTPLDRDNFIDSVEALLPAQVNRDRTVVTYRGRATTVRAHPISIEWPNRWACQSPSIQQCRESVCRELRLPRDIRLGVGVDRLDYTKGICEKLAAVEKLLESCPALVGNFVFVQIAEPSRSALPAYQELRQRLVDTVDRINNRFRGSFYPSVVCLESHHEQADVYRYLRAADLCFVASLRDGMNLVAKEFVAARDDDHGVLVLSRFAGAARELPGALIVNPYSVDASARALVRALEMSDEDQAVRMRSMRTMVARFSARRWVSDLIGDAVALRGGTRWWTRQQADARPRPESRVFS
jgi:trehalose 6-phosphate synthase